MSERMDTIVAAAARQGLSVRQTETGAWVWKTEFQTLITKRTPRTPREFVDLISALHGLGLEFPESIESD